MLRSQDNGHPWRVGHFRWGHLWASSCECWSPKCVLFVNCHGHVAFWHAYFSLRILNMNIKCKKLVSYCRTAVMIKQDNTYECNLNTLQHQSPSYRIFLWMVFKLSNDHSLVLKSMYGPWPALNKITENRTENNRVYYILGIFFFINMHL